MAIKWKREEIEKLILLIQERPCIYNFKCNEYLDRTKKVFAFNEILQEMQKISSGITLEEIKRKWRVLRSQFAQELRMVNYTKESGTGTSATYIPKLWCFDQLSFLKSNTAMRTGQDNIEMSEPIISINSCRTCFSPSKVLKPLVTKTTDFKKRLKSFGEILEEVIQININDDRYQELPQFICGSCSHRLISAYAFIQQAVEVNDKLFSILNKKFDCLEETQIDIEPYMEMQLDIEQHMEIELENNVPETVTNNFDCLQQPEVDVEPCIEIKIEENEWKENIENIKSTVEAKVEDIERNLEEANLALVTDAETSQIQPEFETAQADEFFSSETETSEESEEEVFDIAVPCNGCSKIFRNSKLLARHQKTSHLPEEKKWTCPICDKKYTRNYGVNIHMKTIHGQEKVILTNKRLESDCIYKCDKCPKKYSRKKSLRYHMRCKHLTTNEATENKKY